MKRNRECWSLICSMYNTQVAQVTAGKMSEAGNWVSKVMCAGGGWPHEG